MAPVVAVGRTDPAHAAGCCGAEHPGPQRALPVCPPRPCSRGQQLPRKAPGVQHSGEAVSGEIRDGDDLLQDQ